MTMREPTPSDAALVAIDISKQRNDVLIEIPGKTRRRRLAVVNTRAEHDRFINTLHSLDRPVIAGFEATGDELGNTEAFDLTTGSRSPIGRCRCGN